MRVLRPSTHSTTTSPPRPPLPPLGPPNSMNFSRRKLTAPAPPSPERTKTLAWSRNFIGSRGFGEGGAIGGPARPRQFGVDMAHLLFARKAKPVGAAGF